MVELTTIIKVGDNVRVYDNVNGTGRNYMEGIVTNIGVFPDIDRVKRYQIAVKKTIFSGRKVPNTMGIHYINPPVNMDQTSRNRIVSSIRKLV